MVLGGGVGKPSSQALTLWTVFLRVDSGGGSGKHSTAGPWDRNSHLWGETGWDGAASAQEGTSGWGSISPGRHLWLGLGLLLSRNVGKQSLGQGTLTLKTLLSGRWVSPIQQWKPGYWLL